MAEKGVATKEDLEDACANFAYEDYDFLDDDKLGSIDRMEGFLFPSTYEFDKNRSAVYTVETMLVYFKNSISQQMLEDIKASPYDLEADHHHGLHRSRRSPSATTPSARTSAPLSTTVWRTRAVRRAEERCSCALPSTIS
ncbi:MAG: hypothetical protein ACLUNQ_01660 [Oscillospiraceae bacterium]